ncbi:hypothetical protein J6590_100084 [Homalodisca vitripennis]|nr:hypothetical protein J6590_100084 [Homalodisca vitripennis]
MMAVQLRSPHGLTSKVKCRMWGVREGEYLTSGYKPLCPRSPSNPPDKGYRGVKALANVIQRCGRCFLLPPTFVYKEFTAGSFVALGFPR